MKKRLATIMSVTLLALTMALAAVFGVGCGSVYVTSMTEGTESGTYIVTYSDGTTQTLLLPGRDGKDGEDGKDVTITDVYETYKKETGEDISFSDFLDKYLTLSGSGADNSAVIAQCLRSVAKVYTEFVEQMAGMSWRPVYDINIYTGSAVIWSIDKSDDGYTYLVTNAHVIYDSKAVSRLNGGLTAKRVYCYLYGSEGAPYTVDNDGDGRADTDADGYTAYEYGDYATECEIVGYSYEKDLAVLRAKTSNLLAVNDDIHAVTLADGYHVGETAIAIGNPEDEGISVTEGIVSIDNENITLNIDKQRTYRSIRIDTALYGGNSGGGLFNSNGKLIGIANAGSTQDENINYAIPLEIVKGTVENILYWFGDGNPETNGAYKITMGVTVLSSGSKYVYDSALGYGTIVENVTVQEISEGSIASRFGMAVDDVITAVIVGDKTYFVNRSFNISDIILTMRPGDSVALEYTRGGVSARSQSVVLTLSDFAKID